MSSGEAALIAILESVPKGENPFEYLRIALGNIAFPVITGWYRTQAFVFVGCHFLIALLSIIGIVARMRKGTAWLFRLESNGYLRPNTGLVSQIFFALYSIFYITSIFSIDLVKRPTAGAYAIFLIDYIFLGLAIHVQSWATLYSRPTSTAISIVRQNNSSSASGVLRSPSRFSLFLGPRGFNATMIFTGILFVICIVVGRAIIDTARFEFLAAFNQLDTTLIEFQRTNASLTALVQLSPLFTMLVTSGAQIEHTENVAVRVWIVWAVIWIAAYTPAAITLLLALRQQESYLKKAYVSSAGLTDVVFFAPQDHTTYPPPETPIALLRSYSSASAITPGLASDQEVKFEVGLTPETRQEKVRRGRFSKQRTEIKEKLDAVRRLILILFTQLVATTLMMVVYIGVALFGLIGTQKFTSVEFLSITSSWLGYTFIVPGLFSSSIFAWVSIRSQPSRVDVTSSEKEEEDDDFDETADPFAPQNQIPRTDSRLSPLQLDQDYSSGEREYGTRSNQSKRSNSTRTNTRTHSWLPTGWMQRGDVEGDSNRVDVLPTM